MCVVCVSNQCNPTLHLNIPVTFQHIAYRFIVALACNELKSWTPVLGLILVYRVETGEIGRLRWDEVLNALVCLRGIFVCPLSAQWRADGGIRV